MPFIICGKFLTLCLQHFQLLQLRETLAVVALQQGFTLLDDPEFGCHRLVVGDAFRIAAFYDADEFLRQLQNHFLAHLVILDDVDLRARNEVEAEMYDEKIQEAAALREAVTFKAHHEEFLKKIRG